MVVRAPVRLRCRRDPAAPGRAAPRSSGSLRRQPVTQQSGRPGDGCVLIAQIHNPELDRFQGAGVFYGAAISQASVITGQDVVVVGGELRGSSSELPCRPCAAGNRSGPRRLPRRQHVGLPDPHPATDTEHRHPLSRRDCRRIGRNAAPAAADDPGHLDRGTGSPTRRRGVHHDRRRAADRLAAGRNQADPRDT